MCKNNGDYYYSDGQLKACKIEGIKYEYFPDGTLAFISSPFQIQILLTLSTVHLSR